MTELLKSYDMVSLGATCSCKKYITIHIKKDMYQIFDYVGTSMWSIIELLKNDFAGLLDKDKLVKMNIRSQNELVWTNVTYYVRFLHDLMDAKHINKTIEKNERRIARFKSLINQNKPLILLRLEESQKNRIRYEQYNKYLDKTEHEYVVELSKWLKLNTKLKFRILYLGTKDTHYDVVNNIIFIKTNIDEHTWNNCNITMNNLINENKDVIELGLVNF